MKLVASVIIPTYKDWDDLECCLQALSKQDYPRELFEIIVVNNDIGVSVPKKFDTYKFVKFVSESKPGSYAARNRGISVSSGRVLAFTDSDCVPDKYWLRNGINSLAVEESKYSRIGGNVKLVFSGEITVSDDYERLFSFRQKEFCEYHGYSVTANMICNKSCFDEVGPFSDALMSGGDTEWGKRANSLDERIKYDPSVVVYHPSRSSIRDLCKKMKRVSGGIYVRNSHSIIEKIALIVKSTFPPVGSIKIILKDVETGPWRKLSLIILSFYLKIYRSIIFLCLFSGISKPSRR